MPRLRQTLPAVVVFLAFLLHCTQACLAAGHAHAAVAVASSADHSEHAPCHSPQAAPQEAPEKCPDCTGHVFLRPISSGTETWVAAGIQLSSYLPTHSLPSLQLQLCTSTSQPQTAVFSFPFYLKLSILRL